MGAWSIVWQKKKECVKKNPLLQMPDNHIKIITCSENIRSQSEIFKTYVAINMTGECMRPKFVSCRELFNAKWILLQKFWPQNILEKTTDVSNTGSQKRSLPSHYQELFREIFVNIRPFPFSLSSAIFLKQWTLFGVQKEDIF